MASSGITSPPTLASMPGSGCDPGSTEAVSRSGSRPVIDRAITHASRYASTTMAACHQVSGCAIETAARPSRLSSCCANCSIYVTPQTVCDWMVGLS